MFTWNHICIFICICICIASNLPEAGGYSGCVYPLIRTCQLHCVSIVLCALILFPLCQLLLLCGKIVSAVNFYCNGQFNSHWNTSNSHCEMILRVATLCDCVYDVAPQLWIGSWGFWIDHSYKQLPGSTLYLLRPDMRCYVATKYRASPKEYLNRWVILNLNKNLKKKNHHKN